MGEVIFLEQKEEKTQRLNRQKDGINKDILSSSITQTPQKVEEILKCFSTQEIIEIEKLSDIEDLIFEYFIQEIDKSKIDFNVNIIQSAQYLSNLLFKIWFCNDDEINALMQNPYYTYWLEKWQPKRAADASVYNYIFFKKSLKRPIQRQDYKTFAVNGYAMFYGGDFAFWIDRTLPLLENNKEFEKFLWQKKLHIV